MHGSMPRASSSSRNQALSVTGRLGPAIRSAPILFVDFDELKEVLDAFLGEGWGVVFAMP
jgi:hypothetical protein